MPQQIDELQLKIGSDASAAIRQLGDLSAALDKAATAASGLASANSALSGFGQELTKIQNVNINDTIKSLRRLSKIDLKNISSITPQLDSLSTAVKGMGSVDASITKFVSGLARLSNAGFKTGQSAMGLQRLTPELQKAVSAFQGIGQIDDSVNSFVSSLGKLASAGSKVEQTANNMPQLTTSVVDFLTAMSNAPAINTNIANTIQGLGNLAQAGSKAGSTMNHLASGNKNANAVITMLGKSAHATADAFKKLASAALSFTGKGISAIGSFFGQLGLIPTHTQNVNGLALSFGNLFRAVVPFYGLRGVFDWMKGALETGSGIVEVENVVNTMFGDLKNGYENISGYVYKWAEGTIDAFGVSELAARQYAGKLMAMFTSSGFDASEGMRDQAAKMSMRLVEQAGDIASFYDISVDEAMTKIQAGIAGMNRPLRSLGVNMSVANLQAFALTKGITTQWKELDQATQQWLRYEYILDATQYAMGDFASTSGRESAPCYREVA